MSCRSADDLERAMQDHGDAVFRFALIAVHSTEDAEDVFQNTFLRWFGSGHIDPAAFRDLRKELLRIAAVCCEDIARSNARHATVPLELARDIASPESIDGDDLLVFAAINKLPKAMRIAIHLAYVERYSPTEIAHITREKPVTVRSRLLRARRLLKRLIEEERRG